MYVSMTATLIALDGDVDLYVVLNLLGHVKRTAELIVCNLLVLQCVLTPVPIDVLHVSIHVDSNVEHAHLSVRLDVVQTVILHVRNVVNIHANITVLIRVQKNVVGVQIYAILVLECV